MKAIVASYTETLTIPGWALLKEVKQTFKESGFKGLRKKYGWKIFAAIIGYYLVRDITLYILIPYFAWNLF